MYKCKKSTEISDVGFVESWSYQPSACPIHNHLQIFKKNIGDHLVGQQKKTFRNTQVYLRNVICSLFLFLFLSESKATISFIQFAGSWWSVSGLVLVSFYSCIAKNLFYSVLFYTDSSFFLFWFSLFCSFFLSFFLSVLLFACF